MKYRDLSKLFKLLSLPRYFEKNFILDLCELRPLLIFQIGTNNWQRQGEFAPGSGILHASFHQTTNSILDQISWKNDV